MDQPSIEQTVASSTPVMTPPKQNWTRWIVFLVIFLAIIITGVTYFLVAQKRIVKPAKVTPTQTITAEQAQWKSYTDTTHKYSFYYPDTWTLTKASNDPSKFTLQYNDMKKPGVIRGGFLTKQEKSKLPSTSIYCEEVKNPAAPCHGYDLSKITQAFVHITLEKDTPTLVNAIILRPHDEAISLNVTQPNFDSYQTVAIIIDTLKFTNETRANKIQICPDSWSANKTIATYHGVTFPVADVDLEFIKTDCKK